MTLRIAALDNELQALLAPEFAETPEQGLIKTFLFVCDEPDQPNLVRLLGLSS